MSDEGQKDAGSSTDQYVTGVEETGTFTTDQEPTASAEAHGSSNEGVNTTRANRQEPTAEDQTSS